MEKMNFRLMTAHIRYKDINHNRDLRNRNFGPLKNQNSDRLQSGFPLFPFIRPKEVRGWAKPSYHSMLPSEDSENHTNLKFFDLDN